LPRGGAFRRPTLIHERNRVTPFSELIAHPARGLVYGNRGCLHDEAGRIRRGYNGRRWIACRLLFHHGTPRLARREHHARGLLIFPGGVVPRSGARTTTGQVTILAIDR
jgi:hypothetical protein